MSLLSAGDYRDLKEAMRNREEISLTRTKRDVTVTASTCRVSPPWDVDMVIHIRLEQGNVTHLQNFKTVDAAKQSVHSWQKRLC